MNLLPWLQRVGFGLAWTLAILTQASCTAPPVSHAVEQTPRLLPFPSSIETKPGAFVLSDGATIVANGPTETQIGTYLSDLIQRSTGHDLPVEIEAASAQISLELSPDRDFAPEGYEILVGADGVKVEAATPSGLFYGAVSTWQLLTPADGSDDTLSAPYVTIRDEPRYPWRGVLLDSARHMQSTEYIKTFIDWMALHKLNILHWHLTDDQGWRIEIKAYPELTNKGAWRVPAGRAAQRDIDPNTGRPRLYGGYYSHDEIREIVAYAQERHVTIVPEIDVPGHALAAIVAYPDLGVVEAPTQVMSDWGVYPYLFSPEDTTFEFLDTVLGEVASLFPGEYIHVGGDEAPKHQWRDSQRVQALMRERGIPDEDALQGYFTARLEQILKKYDRRLVGWDEIVEGGLGEDAIVMSWRGLDGAVEAAAHGHQAIIAPNSHLYLDYRQSGLGDEPPGRGRQITLRDMYEFDYLAAAPDPDSLQQSVLGLQANLWTEHMRTEDRVTHMAFPRLAALSELAWSAPIEPDFDEFAQRIGHMLTRYKSIGLPYADSLVQPVLQINWAESTDARANVRLSSQVELGHIRYTTDGTEVIPDSQTFEYETLLPWGTEVRASVFFEGEQISRQLEWVIERDAAFAFQDTDLEACNQALVLHLEDDAPVGGERPNFQVDIMNPCWKLAAVDLADVESIELTLGQVPYNFQLMDDIKTVVVHPALDSGAAISIHAGTCDSAAIGSVPIPLDNPTDELIVQTGNLDTTEMINTDLCFLSSTGVLDPVWVIHSGRLIHSKNGASE